MSEAPSKTTRKLTTMESFTLVSLMKEEERGYAAKGLNDPEYAVYVNSLGLNFTVTVGNIQGARTAMGLPATKFVQSNAAKTAAEDVLSRLAAVEDKLDRLLRYFSEQARRDL